MAQETAMNEQSRPPPFEDVMNPTLEEIIASSEESLRDIAAGRVYDIEDVLAELVQRMEARIAANEARKQGPDANP